MIAIVPVNSPERGKRRLASAFSTEEREALVHAMLADVVAACRAAPAIDDVVVVSPDATLAPPGCSLSIDPGRGHAAALRHALAETGSEAGALVVMADCPLVPPETLDRLACSVAPVAIGPAQDGGTNALALHPADVIEPAFGVSNGAAVVAERATRAGVEHEVIRDVLLELDLDTPEDAQKIVELGTETITQQLLASLLESPARAS